MSEPASRDDADHGGKLPIARRLLGHDDGGEEREQGRERALRLRIAAHEDHRLLALSHADDGSIEHLDVGDGRDGLYLAGETRTRYAQVDAERTRVHELEQTLVAQIQVLDIGRGVQRRDDDLAPEQGFHPIVDERHARIAQSRGLTRIMTCDDDIESRGLELDDRLDDGRLRRPAKKRDTRVERTYHRLLPTVDLVRDAIGDGNLLATIAAPEHDGDHTRSDVRTDDGANLAADGGNGTLGTIEMLLDPLDVTFRICGSREHDAV